MKNLKESVAQVNFVHKNNEYIYLSNASHFGP